MKGLEKKEYLWYCLELDELFTLEQAPRPGSEEKLHHITRTDSEGQDFLEVAIGIQYIGEL